MGMEGLPDHIYTHLAQLGQALADPTRLRILNLLAQTERSVDDLASLLGHSAPNTSAHLKALYQARMVERRKEGRYVFYRLSSSYTLRLWLSLRDMGLEEIPEVREAMRDYEDELGAESDLEADELLEKVATGEVVLLDLRPAEEFAAGRIPNARSIPLAELEQRLGELESDRTIVAYCRGPYCVGLLRGVEQLRQHGYDVRPLRDGIADWRAAERPLEFPETEVFEAQP